MRIKTIPVKIANNPRFTTNCYLLFSEADANGKASTAAAQGSGNVTSSGRIFDAIALMKGDAEASTESGAAASPATPEQRPWAIAIDPGDEPLRILEELGNSKLAAIVISPGHYDHISAVAALVAATGAKVYAHALDAEAILTNFQQIKSGYEDFSKKLYGRFKGYAGFDLSASAPKVDVRLQDGDRIVCADIALEVMHTPGHSPGSSCLYDRDGARLFSGDTLFQGTCGRTDFAGGSPKSMHDSLQRLSKLPVQTQVYSGHGEKTSIDAEIGLGLSEY